MGLFGPPDVEKMKAKRDVKGLIKALGYEKDSDIRRDAADALERIRDARAVEPLIAALRDRARDVRGAAAHALGWFGDARAIEPLIAALKDSAGEVRRAAAWALGQFRDARAVEPLIAALKESDADVRKAAAGALVKIGTPAVEPLVGALRDGDGSVREAAAGALDKIGWRPGRDESGAAFCVFKGRWDKCVEIGQPAVGPLIAALKCDLGPVRREAAAALGQIRNARAVEPLIAALKHGDVSTRAAVARALEQIGDTRAIEPLVAVLEDKYVREEAAAALHKLGWQPGQDECGARYFVGRGEWDRCIEIGAPAVASLVEVLEGWLKGTVEAAVALGYIGDARAVKALIAKAVEGGEAYVGRRKAAAEALIMIGAPAVTPLILELNNGG